MARSKERKSKVSVRPDKTTFRIVFFGGVIAAAVWFLLVSPAQSDAEKAATERKEAQRTFEQLSEEIATFRSGESFTSEEIRRAVSDIETLLPQSGAPGPAANRIRDLATANGLTVVNISFPNAYTPAGPGQLKAEVKVEVTGSSEGVTRWLEALANFDQLVTVTTSGPTVDSTTGATTIAITATVWATTLESWANGLPQDTSGAETGEGN